MTADIDNPNPNIPSFIVLHAFGYLGKGRAGNVIQIVVVTGMKWFISFNRTAEQEIWELGADGNFKEVEFRF